VPEVRRLVLAMTEPEEERSFRLGWSMWRRAHQAVAKRCHAARRALRREGAPTKPKRPATTAIGADAAPLITKLTEADWECVRPLLPPQKPPSGRPRRDHRTVLAGILWVLGSGSLRGETFRKRSLELGRRFMAATANGMKKGFGSA